VHCFEFSNQMSNTVSYASSSHFLPLSASVGGSFFAVCVTSLSLRLRIWRSEESVYPEQCELSHSQNCTGIKERERVGGSGTWSGSHKWWRSVLEMVGVRWE